VEEIFIKAHHYERLALAEWTKGVISAQQGSPDDPILLLSSMDPSDGDLGKPERWQIKTLDSGRYNNFRFNKKLIFVSIPPQNDEKSLFSVAIRIFKRVAVPLSLVLARYEFVKQGHVVGVNASREALKKLIECNRELDEQQDPSKKNLDLASSKLARLKEELRDMGMNDDLYRQVSLR
jgi:hypothetical protein